MYECPCECLCMCACVFSNLLRFFSRVWRNIVWIFRYLRWSVPLSGTRRSFELGNENTTDWAGLERAWVSRLRCVLSTQNDWSSYFPASDPSLKVEVGGRPKTYSGLKTEEKSWLFLSPVAKCPPEQFKEAPLMKCVCSTSLVLKLWVATHKWITAGEPRGSGNDTRLPPCLVRFIL